MQDLKSNKEIYKIRDIISFGIKNARPRSMDTIEIFTQNRCEFVNITRLVESSLKKSAIRSGIGVIFCPHTTAGLTINECWDPDVIHDTLHWLEKSIPKNLAKFLHGEGNSDSHIKTGLFGNSSHVIVEEGKIILGQWQGIFLCEFDGPRPRQVHVQWVGKQN
jgi:secondary thiamine-phosphate synthase enzyme